MKLFAQLCILSFSLLCFSCTSQIVNLDNSLPEQGYQDSSPLTVAIEADHPEIQYIGRVDFTDAKAPEFSFPGTSIRASFQGTGIDVIISGSQSDNFFNVIIDGKSVTVIQTIPGPKTFSIARNLVEGTHTIEIFKRTEGTHASFLGFNLEQGKTLVSAPPLPERKIEFYGDSITAGYGNEIAVADPSSYHFTPRNENNYNAYGAITARQLNAQYVAVCASGNGIFRNYGGGEDNLVPSYLNRIYFDRPTDGYWNTSNYIPDVVVICLGANDYNSELNKKDISHAEFDTKFGEKYAQFIHALRTAYGKDTKIICATDVSRYYPKETLAFSRVTKLMSNLVENLQQQGDKNIIQTVLFDENNPPWGEDFHPSYATHKQYAQVLIPLIKKMIGW